MSVVRSLWSLPLIVLPWAACDSGKDTPADIAQPDTIQPDTVQPDTVQPDTTQPDTSLPETVADTEDTADDTGEVDIGPIGCASFELSGDLVAKDAPGVFQLGGNVDLGLGGPLPDAVVFEFYSDETGSFDLAADGNDNYKTCSQCVRFVQDIDPTGATPSKNFFQKAGRLTIDASTPPNGTDIKLTLEDLEMIEVTIRAADFQTTPVPDGACYEGPPALTLETGACVPACGAHACGPDGCGGECGTACPGEQQCRIDGSTCESTPTCVDLAITGTLDNIAAGVFRVEVTELGLGAVGADDFVQIEFYKDQTGTFDLAGPSNRNYSTCNQCVRLVVDGRRELFQQRGEMVIGDVSVPLGEPETEGFVDLVLNGVVLEEVVIDEEFNSMPIDGGACVRLVDGRVSSPLP